MRFAFALFRYFPYGGLQRDMVAIARAIRARGHDVTFYCRDWQGDAPDDMAVESLGGAGLSNHARDRDFARRLGASGARDADVLVGFNKMPGLDCYYAADGCLAARYAGQAKRLLPRYRSRLAMEASVFSAGTKTQILSISPPQKALYQACYGTDDARFCDLPPGIRRDRVLPPDYAQRRRSHRQSLSLSDATPMFLFVGSGFRTKGLDRALHAFAAQPEHTGQFYIVGDDDAAPYQRLARRLGVADRVHFMGGQPDVPSWLWSADLLLHPAYAENTGTVLLEAAVGGLPVVTSSACGYAPWIEEADMGAVIPEARLDTQALVDAIADIRARPREQWCERGARFATRADIFSLVDHAVDCITGEART